MKTLRKLWLLFTLILISLIIWFGGRYVSIADYVPLESSLARMIAIALVVVLWGAKALLHQFKAARAGKRLVKEVARQEDPALARASADTRQMRQRFEEAVDALQKSKKGRINLYELPWYIIIGPPGAGKTTAIVNSGLNFPLAQKFGKEALRGVGGTRNCDWWFTEQAILLDTAGRYTTQDSDQASDAAGWREFLALLRKYRKRRPINGVLVAMSVADLATQSDSDRDRHIAAIRERLDELHRELRITLPVYLLLTKSDLLAGFSEFFDDLSPEGRQQVWGATFDLKASRAGTAAEQFAPELALLLERLNGVTLARMDSERDVQRRGLIFGFPRQFAGVRRALQEFVSEAFGRSAFERGALLRGVYFTSGTQEGTPIDRMLGALARTFGLGVKAINTPANRGRAYFIQRLLTEVIFRESGLAGTNRRMEMRQALAQASVYLGCLAVATVGLVALAISYGRNRAYLSEVQTATAPLASLNTATPATLDAWLPRLDAYHEALAAAEKYRDHVPFSMRMGLYQGSGLGGAALDAYLRELNAGLAPGIAAAFRDRLPQLASEADKLYAYLKVYLMLGTPEHLIPEEIKFFTDLEWHRRFASDAAKIERLDAHLDALVADKNRVQPVTLDAGVVERARTSLRAASFPVLMYSQLKLSHARDDEHALHLDREIGLGGDSVLVRKSGVPLSQPIPAIYTRKVFNEVATQEKLTIANEFVGNSWVLGEGVASKTDIPRLANDLMGIYEDDYIRVWDALLADLAPKPTTGAQQLTDMMALIASPSSPLKRLLVVVEANTNLLKAADPSDKVAGVKAAIAATVDRAGQMFGTAAAPEKSGARVTKHFAALHKLVDGPPGAAPIDQTMHAIGQIQQQLAGMGGGLGATNALSAVASPGQANALGQLRIEAKQLPEPISAMVAQIGSKSETVAKGAAGEELARRYQTEVVEECRQLISGRYPFMAQSGNDVALADFARLFGSGGVFDSFFKERLAPLIDTSTMPWHWKEGAAALGGSKAMLEQFQTVERIRQIYFRPGGQTPELHFNMAPQSLDTAVSRLAVDIDGQTIEYRHGAPRAQGIAWPGPSPGQASVLFEEGGGSGPNHSYQGPWAFFRMLDGALVQPQSDLHYLVTLTAGSRSAGVMLEATSVRNPFAHNELRGFRCGG
jgi:type VI secretion system protein ImpL